MLTIITAIVITIIIVIIITIFVVVVIIIFNIVIAIGIFSNLMFLTVNKKSFGNEHWSKLVIKTVRLYQWCSFSVFGENFESFLKFNSLFCWCSFGVILLCFTVDN